MSRRPGLGPTKLLEAIAASALLLLCGLIIASAVMRYTGSGNPKLFEATRVVFVYLIGISAIAAFARDQNVYVPGWWRVTSASYQALMLALSCGILYLSVRFLVKTGLEEDATSLFGLPEVTHYVPVAIFAAGLVVVSAARLVEAIKARRAIPA